MQKKWLSEASALGSSPILTSTPLSTAAIHAHITATQSPLNITQVYHGLKGLVPSPLLKKCLDRMTDGEKNGGKSGEFSLKKLEGRNASNTVYYCYEQNGASAEARNDANEAIEALKQTIERNSVESKEMLSKENKLLSEVSELK